MPVIKTKTIRTMRDLWDKEKSLIKAQESQNEIDIPQVPRQLGEQEQEGLVKTRRYFLEHLELKKVVMDFFPEYQRYLGEAGFLKVF